MATRKATRGAKAKSDVIDVGDGTAAPRPAVDADADSAGAPRGKRSAASSPARARSAARDDGDGDKDDSDEDEDKDGDKRAAKDGDGDDEQDGGDGDDDVESLGGGSIIDISSDGDADHDGAAARGEVEGDVVDVLGGPGEDRPRRRGRRANDDADGEDSSEASDDDAPRASGATTLPARRDPLAVYMSETRRFPLLTPDEEHDLAVKLVEHGDNRAARRLVESNLRLVVKIAYEYRRAHKNLLDLVQEGNIGLMQAVRKFDPYRGVKLSSYAAFWIRAYILKFILNNWRLVKIGTTQAQRKLFFNLRKEREKLEQLGFQPTAALLAEKLDVSEQEVVEMERRLAAPEASLDAPIGNDDDGARSRLDFIPGADRPDRNVEQTEFSELLRGKLETFAKGLEGREESIFRERWLTEDPLTLQELGDRYGVSRERARQLEKRLLTKLRKYLEDEFGSSVDIGALIRE